MTQLYSIYLAVGTFVIQRQRFFIEKLWSSFETTQAFFQEAVIGFLCRFGTRNLAGLGDQGIQFYLMYNIYIYIDVYIDIYIYIYIYR